MSAVAVRSAVFSSRVIVVLKADHNLVQFAKGPVYNIWFDLRFLEWSKQRKRKWKRYQDLGAQDTLVHRQAREGEDKGE